MIEKEKETEYEMMEKKDRKGDRKKICENENAQLK